MLLRRASHRGAHRPAGRALRPAVDARRGDDGALRFALFLARLDLGPVAVSTIQVALPIGIAVTATLVQRVSVRLGRIPTTLLCRLTGIGLLVALTFVPIDGTNEHAGLIVGLYLVRTWLMNCTSGLTKSVLNDSCAPATAQVERIGEPQPLLERQRGARRVSDRPHRLPAHVSGDGGLQLRGDARPHRAARAVRTAMAPARARRCRCRRRCRADGASVARRRRSTLRGQLNGSGSGTHGGCGGLPPSGLVPASASVDSRLDAVSYAVGAPGGARPGAVPPPAATSTSEPLLPIVDPLNPRRSGSRRSIMPSFVQ